VIAYARLSPTHKRTKRNAPEPEAWTQSTSVDSFSHLPTVSVIVPNFNHARFLPQRLDSILQHTFRDWRLIILDDTSASLKRRFGSHRVRLCSLRAPAARNFSPEQVRRKRNEIYAAVTAAHPTARFGN